MTDYTFHELIEQFLINQDIYPISRRSYRSWLRPFHRWIVDNSINVLEVRKPQIIEYKSYLTANYTDKTVNCYLTAIRLFYSWSEQNGYINYNPTIGIRFIRLDKRHRKHPLTPEQSKQLLNSCDMNTATGRRAYLIIRLMLVTGLRAVEVSKLEHTDIEDNYICIQGKGQTSKNHRIEITDELIRMIRQFGGTRYIFETIRNKQLSPAYISELLEKQMIKAGIKSKYISGHSLRHTAAIEAMKQTGNNIYETQKLLRHTNTKTTEIYIRTLQDEQTKVSTIVREMDKRLGNPKIITNTGIIHSKS